MNQNNSSLRRKRLLVISQTYVPDPAAVGQHMHDVAARMARRGWEVIAITSGRGYDDPTVIYPAREMRQGVRILRLPWSSFGKRSIPVRLAGQGLYLLQTILRGMFLGKVDAILVSTSPPMAAIAALAIHWVRRAPIKFWLMDLNPDQAVALGKVKAGSLPVKMLDWLNRRLYRAAEDVIVLDRFMADRANAKVNIQEKITILPPWPLEEPVEPVAPENNPFRAEHKLSGKFVFMYSGNMSVASPLTTLLQAVLLLRDDPTMHFMFIGGGQGKKEVERMVAQERPENVTVLPYQPLEQLKYSLGAADVHLATLGENMVGMIHPCKVYGAMAVARPVLFCGPKPSHMTDLIDRHGIGWHVRHGDAEGCAALMRRIAGLPSTELRAMGTKAQQVITQELSGKILGSAFADVVERRPR